MVLRKTLLTALIPLLAPLAHAENFNAVSDRDVQAASSGCRFTQGASSAYRQAVIAEAARLNTTEPGSRYEVHGIRFENESPELVRRFMQLTTTLDFANRIDAKGQAEIPRGLVPRDCKKAQCALAAIFGASRAEKMLYLLLVHDVNTSPYRSQNADLPDESELDAFIETLDLAPPFLSQIRSNKQMIRFKRGYGLAINGPNVMADATMEFFDLWSSQSHATRIYAAFHELAHNWSDSQSSQWDVSPSWLQATGWKKNGDDWIATRSTGFVSHYARTNPSEDFAESASAYRFTPERLKKISPARYEFLRKVVFGGMEFKQNQDSCPSLPSLLTASASEFDRITSSKAEFAPHASKLASLCEEELARALVKPSEQYLFRACIERELMLGIARDKTGDSLPDLPRYLLAPLTKGTRNLPQARVNDALKAGTQGLSRFCDLKHSFGFLPSEVQPRLMKEKGLSADDPHTLLYGINVSLALPKVCGEAK